MKLGRKKRKDKLYQQWEKHGELSPETIPQKDSSGDMPVGREKMKQRLLILYILLGIGIVALGAGLVLFFIQ